MTRFVARLLNLDVNPSNVKVIASYVAQQYDSHESVLLLTIYFLGGQSPRCFPSVSAIVVASLKRAQGGADPPVTIFTDQTALEKTSSGVVLIYVSALNSFASPSFDADDYAYAQLGSVCLSSNGSPASTQTTIFSAIVLDSVSMLSIENCREIAIAAAPTTIFRAGEALRNTNADHLIITGSPSLLNADPLWSEFVQQAKIAADLPELFL